MEKMAVFAILVVAAVLLVLALSSAGIGPSQAHTTFEVIFTGADAPQDLIFVCSAPSSVLGQQSSTVEQREISLECSADRCVSGNWFSNYNPCYNPDRGRFRYTNSLGAKVLTDEIPLGSAAQAYRIKMSERTGRVVSVEETGTQGGWCQIPSIALLIPLFAGAFIRSRA
jgi:hypothetical protein